MISNKIPSNISFRVMSTGRQVHISYNKTKIIFKMIIVEAEKKKKKKKKKKGLVYIYIKEF